MLSVLALWNKPWVWNTFYCWYGYPFHAIGKYLDLCILINPMPLP